MQNHRPNGYSVPESIRRLPEFSKFHGKLDDAELVEALKIVGTEIHGQYRVLKFLGFGGMGNVYQARDLENGMEVAIKITRQNVVDNPALMARFERENRAMAMLRHPNVVEIYDVGGFSNRQFCVMEFLKGVDLNEVLKKEGPIPWDKLKSIMLQVCRGVGEAHKIEIIHRDLKPANIFLVRKDGEETAKVIDFGMVKFEQESQAKLTATGIVVGTPSYWAPEQTTGRHDYDHRLDIWAVGVIMYELLTGRVPFEGNLTEKMIRIQKDRPRAPTEIDPNIPAEVEDIIFKCLEKRPHERFQSMDELIRAISATRGPAKYEGSVVSEDLLLDLIRESEPPPKLSLPALDISLGSIERSAETELIERPLMMDRPRRKGGALKRLAFGLAALSIVGGVGYYGYLHREQAKRYYDQYTAPGGSQSAPAPSNSAPPAQESQSGFMVRLSGPSGAYVLEITPDNPRGVELGRIDRNGEFYRRFDDGAEHTLEVRRRGGSSGPFTVSPSRTTHRVNLGARGGGTRRQDQGSGVEFGDPEVAEDREE